MSPITLTINGADEAVQADARTTLLDVLRNELGLTGAKLGCNQGVCGACTVLIDGKPARACLTLAVACTGDAITTIEGLADAAGSSPLQHAFVASGAVQCGFCTPGMILAAKALLDGEKRPSVERIREALSGNLCRCSGYIKIVEAVQRAGAAA